MSKDDKRRYLILKDHNIIKGLAILAFPVMLNNFARTLHDLVDMFFLSKTDATGSSPIAAIQITFPITFMYISLAIGLSIAGTALISQYYGANQVEQAKKYATHLAILAVLIGIIFNLVAFFSAGPMINLVGILNPDPVDSAAVLMNATKYLKIRSFEMPFTFIFFAFTAIRQASGDTKSPVILGVITIILNIILTPILVLGDVEIFGTTISFFSLGVSGAALATTAATILVMPAGIYLLFKSKDGLTVSTKYKKLEKRSSMSLLKTAAPASFGQAITAIGFLVLNMFIFSYGEETVAAFGIGNRISSIFLHPVMAIGGVMAAYIGQNIGNLNPVRAKRVFREGIILSVGLMTIGSLIGLMIRRPMALLFFDAADPALELSVQYMFYLFAGLPLMAVFQAFIGVYNGTGRTIFTFWIGIIRLWLIRIPLIILFGRFTDWGSGGIWWAMLFSNFIIVFVGLTFFKFIKFDPKIDIEPQLK